MDNFVESEEEEAMGIDWSKGRCRNCARRGTRGYDCRKCGPPRKYEPFIGECEHCGESGSLISACDNCEDMCSPHLPGYHKIDTAREESVEDTDEDSEYNQYREEFLVSDNAKESGDEDEESEEEKEEKEKGEEKN